MMLRNKKVKYKFFRQECGMNDPLKLLFLTDQTITFLIKEKIVSGCLS